eukprot:2043362-Alexandrium_andersonii.AAC.1
MGQTALAAARNQKVGATKRQCPALQAPRVARRLWHPDLHCGRLRRYIVNADPRRGQFGPLGA